MRFRQGCEACPCKSDQLLKDEGRSGADVIDKERAHGIATPESRLWLMARLQFSCEHGLFCSASPKVAVLVFEDREKMYGSS